MAHPFSDCPSRLRCSFKTATALVCACNVLAALFVLRSLVSPLALFSSSSSSSSSYPSLGVVLQPRRSPLRAVRYNEEQLNRIKEAVEAWKAAEPVELIKRVKEIQLESAAGLLRMKQAEAAREKVASDLTQRLKELREAGNQSDQQALEEWRRKKLAEAKVREEAAKTEQKELKAAADAQAAGMG